MLLLHQKLVENRKNQEQQNQEKNLFTFLDDYGSPVKGQTYTLSTFDDITQALAYKILSSKEQGGYGINKGELVLLVYPPGLDFIVAFVACLRAGVVAVPCYPPRPGMNKDLKMFLAIQNSCKAKYAFTNTQYDWGKRVVAIKESFNTFFSSSNDPNAAKWPELHWFVTDGNHKKVDNTPSGMIDSSVASDIAFLQYTSGSTSAPKGVMLSHGNLAHNLHSIIAALKASDKTIVVSWLPIYHDMGLIGSLLGIVYCGGSGYYMSPVSFIKNPPVWLTATSQYHATHLQAPNFAYKLCVRKFKAIPANQQPKLNLSSVQHIFNAAEPIDPDAIDLFLDTFGPYGLKPEAMVPGYGLAEHTVYVCDGGKQRLTVDKKLLETENRVEIVPSEKTKEIPVSTLVGCGYPHRIPENGIKVIIVDPNTKTVLDEDRVGEIWITSPSKSNGYYGLEEKSKEELHAKLEKKAKLEGSQDEQTKDNNDKEEELLKYEWLRSGDLGFLHQEELFICGRIKDMIIIRGRNHYPQDIEHSIETCDENIRPGCVAAFTLEHQGSKEERLGAICEVREGNSINYENITKKICQAITTVHGVRPFTISLIKEKSIPKTTSGKISRHRC